MLEIVSKAQCFNIPEAKAFNIYAYQFAILEPTLEGQAILLCGSARTVQLVPRALFVHITLALPEAFHDRDGLLVERD